MTARTSRKEKKVLIPVFPGIDLSFVKRVHPTKFKGFNYWAPRPTGSFMHDCALGRGYGAELLPLLRGPDGFDLLVFIFSAILEKGDLERDLGVVVGMMGAIAGVFEHQRKGPP